MTPVGRYRRVRSRLWLDPPFKELSDSEKLVSLYVLTGPPTNGVGVFRLSPGAAAEDLGMTTETFRRRFDAALRAFGWRYDAAARVLWIPDWITENAPQNPNVVRSWRAAFDELPECGVKAEAAISIQAFLEAKGESFGKAFGESFGKALAFDHSPDPDPDPDPAPVSEIVRRTERAERQRASVASTRETVRRLRVLAEHSETLARSGS